MATNDEWAMEALAVYLIVPYTLDLLAVSNRRMIGGICLKQILEPK